MAKLQIGEMIERLRQELVGQMMAQDRVVDAVERRGYRAEWTAEEFAVRLYKRQRDGMRLAKVEFTV